MWINNIWIVRTSINGSQTIRIHWKTETIITWAVLVWDWKYFRWYKWLWTKVDWKQDVTSIVSRWNTLSPSVALIIFGDVKIGTKKLSQHYQMN